MHHPGEELGARSAIQPGRGGEDLAERAVQWVETALVVDRGNWPGEEDLVAPAQFLNKTQDMPIAGEPVVIVLLDRPIPARDLEARRQPTNRLVGLEDGHLAAGAGQVIGCRKSPCAGAHDRHLLQMVASSAISDRS